MDSPIRRSGAIYDIPPVGDNLELEHTLKDNRTGTEWEIQWNRLWWNNQRQFNDLIDEGKYYRCNALDRIVPFDEPPQHQLALKWKQSKVFLDEPYTRVDLRVFLFQLLTMMPKVDALTCSCASRRFPVVPCLEHDCIRHRIWNVPDWEYNEKRLICRTKFMEILENASFLRSQKKT